MRRALIACALALSACEAQTTAAGDTADVTALAPDDLPAFFDCLRQNGQAAVSAHRGGPVPGFAENAIPTFENTLSQAPAFMEIDIARTRDGMLVLMHDDTVDRTTDGTGAVSSLTRDAFEALRLQDNDGAVLAAHPPTLRQALDWADGRTVLELDVKRGVSYEDVAREVDAAGAMDRVVFITYSIDGASRLARVAPEAMIYTTIERAGDLDTLEQRGVDLGRVVAWLGTERPDEMLVAALATRGVEARMGRFGHADRGDTGFAGGRGGGRFHRAALAGARIVAVDDPAGAARDLDANDGADGYAALQCVGVRNIISVRTDQ